MGFTEQGEGLLQDRPAGTGTRKLSGVAPPPAPCPCLEGSPFFIPHLGRVPWSESCGREGEQGPVE